MPQKIRDIAVKTGSYTDNQGNEKGRWQNVGALMKGDDGNEFIIMQRWFNPAGVVNPDNRDSLVLSCFKADNNRQQGGGQQSGQSQGGGQAPAGGGDLDDVPFAAVDWRFA